MRIGHDLHLIYEKIEKCDIIVIGTPIYWYNPTAKTKLFIDRLRPYFVNKKLIGKKVALILSAGSGAGDCDLTIETFKRICAALGMEYMGEVISESYNIGDAENDASAVLSIKVLSDKITI
jgi:multimeric flavodoxin WrbA